LAVGRDVAVAVELKTLFLFVVPLVEGEWSGKMGRESGRARKGGRRGGVVSRARLERVSPTRLREEGGSC